LTFLFGFAFGGSGGEDDARLPVAFLDLDNRSLSTRLREQLAASEVIRLVDYGRATAADLEIAVVNEEIAAALIVPEGYTRLMMHGRVSEITLIGDTNTAIGLTVQNAVLAASTHMDSAVTTALILERLAGDRMPFDYALDEALAAWEEPPISVSETKSTVVEVQNSQGMQLSHTSPGMMVQFAIAGLMTAAQILVSERKSRALQRMLTTSTLRIHILLGHLLAIFIIILGQFSLLITFGQMVFGVNYLREPIAILIVAVSTAACIGSLGLLIGVLAKTEDQAVIFSLIPMFLLSGFGGAMMPLEVTGETFQAIGHISPVAWAMDGFKNITLRGMGIESSFIPALALLGYAVVFFVLAAWRFQVTSERM
jgi:ABC-2 type transport system permease protein